MSESTLEANIAAAQACLDDAGLIAALQDLVRIPSVFDPIRRDGNERAAAEYVMRLLDAWNIPYRTREVAPSRPNVVADLVGNAPGPLLIFEGHTDVVTAGNLEHWQHDPFCGAIIDGRIYGRGTCDMKGGLAAMLFAAAAIKQSGVPFPGTIRLAVMADEEGLMQGAKGFVADGELNGAAAAIICEPEGDRVCLASKGAVRLRTRIHGKMAHGAMPYEGINPVTALAEAIVGLRWLEWEIQAEHPEHPLLGQFHLSTTGVFAGEPSQTNVIPAVAEALLDLRTTPQHDHADLIARVRQVLTDAVATVPGATFDLEIIDDRPATETAENTAIVNAVLAAHQAETGTVPPFGGVPGSTDGTIFWAATGLPTVVWGPGETLLPHQADEYVAVADVVRYARMYIAAALRFSALHAGGEG